jgi:UDP-2,3-diacylglucosamine pyrophosphatase LpxH
MEALPKVVPVDPRPPKDQQIEEHLVMHISDGHHDQIVKPSECGGLERYNFPISMRRGEHYVDTLLKWSQHTLAPQFHFPTLTVLAYGDHTSGEIHGAAQRSYFRNQFKNSFAIGQLHALMYRDLAPYFETVNVVYVPGNHGRRSMKKDYHGAHDNWDYMVAETARLHCRDIKNINFVIPDTFTININIHGVGFCVFHGDDIRSNLGIPWYGMERRQRRIMALSSMQGETRIRYYCCGHFHRPASMNELDGEMLMNGAWVASDAYAYNSFGGYTEPSQLIHGVNSKYGITWRMPVKLKTDNEQDGPQRYKIDMMEDVG